ncbi:tetratricopeptide repeat protein [Agarivorans sp. MS3-6]|uniref:tetratricopeptide repeat protein n=1 Tax=Agarivorans sp. TSD2052 TaxID=2937286 RepID=UPI00200EDC97|nr:tetratricopeptide repeat protein [Agarivorans sp. TSD2052]UPW17268.1 sel1 repeat family protein [Agarivorans sp. TSD2052]
MKKSLYCLVGISASMLVACSNTNDAPVNSSETSAIVCSGSCGQEQFDLAQQLHTGDGVEQNYDAALAAYLKAANLGNVPAMTQAAVLYSEGLTNQGVNKEAALQWLTMAAKQQDGEAQFLLAEHYWSEQDYGQAEFWYNQAALNKHKEAAYLLGLYYFEGTNMEEDPEQAYVWMSIAALLGHSNAPGDRDFLIGEELDMTQKKAAWAEVARLIETMGIEVPW